MSLTNNALFEEYVVAWLLRRYEIFETRTRFMLMDVLDKHLGGPRWLTLNAFQAFFPAFPVRLELYLAGVRAADRLTANAVLCNFESTGLFRRWIDRKRNYPAAIIVRWKFQERPAESLVVHNVGPIDPRIPGPHLCYRFRDGDCLYIERLDGFFAQLDLREPPGCWLSSALNSQFRTPVERKANEWLGRDEI